MHEVSKDLNLLHYSNASITVNIPKLHTALNLSVWLSSVWWKPLGVRRRAQRIWPAVVWAIILMSSTVATLPTHTGGKGSYENEQKWGSPDHSNASTTLSSHGHTRYSEVSVEVGIQRDTESWDLHYATRCHSSFYGQNSTEDKEKGWYKKVTLTTISICRSTEDVLHCNPILGFQVSKGAWGYKYGFDWCFLWLRRKFLWLWQGITFLLITSMLSTGFFCNLSLASQKWYYTTEAAPCISNFITGQPGRPKHSFLAVLS